MSLEAGSGFDGDTNIATILDRTGASQSLPLMSKDELADRIFDHFLELKNRADMGSLEPKPAKYFVACSFCRSHC